MTEAIEKLANSLLKTIREMEQERLKYCETCEEDFYNGKNPYGIKRCWHFEKAQVQDREVYLSSSDIKPTKMKTLSCWRRKIGDW